MKIRHHIFAHALALGLGASMLLFMDKISLTMSVVYGVLISLFSVLSTHLVIYLQVAKKSVAWINVAIVLKYAIIGILVYSAAQGEFNQVLFTAVGFILGLACFVAMTWAIERSRIRKS